MISLFWASVTDGGPMSLNTAISILSLEFLKMNYAIQTLQRKRRGYILKI